MRKVAWSGAVHLATDEALGGFVRIVCSAIVIPLFSPRWQGRPDDTKLTCKDCRALERRQKKVREG